MPLPPVSLLPVSSASCKNLDLTGRSRSTDRFQIVLNDLGRGSFHAISGQVAQQG